MRGRSYASELLTLVNTFVTPLATLSTPAIAARAIKQTRRAYSHKILPFLAGHQTFANL